MSRPGRRRGDVLALRGLRVRGRHGVLAAERELGQEFLVDVEMSLDTSAAAASDDLRHTVDYGALAVALADVVAGEPVELVETLAQRLADVVLRAGAVRTVTVTVHKPQAPVTVPFDDVTVSVTRPCGPAAVVALGSNLGDRPAHLRAAVELFSVAYRVSAVSPVYETEPVGGPEQGPYLNAVLLVEGPSPRELLRFGHAVERSRDRVRDVRWGPRTLDVDLVAAERVVDEPDLTLPHPRAHERAFVLAPWLDVAPEAELTGVGPVAGLLAGLDTTGLRRRDDLVLPLAPGRWSAP